MVPSSSSATDMTSLPRSPGTSTIGASTGGAGRSGISSHSIVRIALPPMKNLISGSYGSTMSMWDSTVGTSLSLFFAVP